MKQQAKRFVIYLSCILLLSSCAKNIVLPYQANGNGTGTVKIKPSTSIKAASVTMDGNMIWEKKKRIKSITITNVPKGVHNVNVVSESWYYKEALNYKESVSVNANDNKALLVSVPPYSTGYYLYWTAIIIVCLLPSVFAL